LLDRADAIADDIALTLLENGRDYYDAMTVVTQLGLMPEPAATSA